MRKKHGMYPAGSKGDWNYVNEEDKPILSTFAIKLDFICDDIFDPDVKKYPKTGHLFQRVIVPGATKKKKDCEFLTILTVVLVSKKKAERKKVKKSTPQKKDVMILFEDLESNGRYEDGCGETIDEDDDDDL